jgi:hypothetical protein
MQSTYLTLRQVPKKVLLKLRSEAKHRGISVNKLASELLARSLGLAEEPRDNGLGALAGTWSQKEFQEFNKAVDELSKPDPELWK